MNRHTPGRHDGEAKIRYLDGDFQVITPGSYVRCAVTGKAIPLDELRYWNVDLQEAYADPDAALTRHKQIKDQA
ncbi:DUF2093 domain-containing protein [Amorphus sp. 3PC139-8]|uniref:DUF2093 domain-containing protein n=1 Tax=Amorphus sp. 3PC139-8 TaxID=2735676 RepID=UPI00345C8470